MPKDARLDRRDFLKKAAAVAGVTIAAGNLASLTACAPAAAPQPTTAAAPAAAGAAAAPAAAGTKPVYMGTVIRTISNEYGAMVVKGARKYADSVGMGNNHRGLFCEGDSEKQLTLVKSLLNEAGQDAVFYIDANQSPDCRPIAEALFKAKVYFVTMWNKPDDLHPWDFDPYYVLHSLPPGEESGYFIATELFKAMGGKGKIVALQGLLANVPAIERFNGLKRAMKESPGIELLAEQTAEWDQTKALNLTENWLARFPNQINGIWAANDSMGLGALEALRAAKLNKKIPIVGIDGTGEAVQACIDKEFVATVGNDPYWQGGWGLAMAMHARNGDFDPSKQPKEHREFYHKAVNITAQNAVEIKATTIDKIPDFDYNDYWGKAVGPIVYTKA